MLACLLVVSILVAPTGFPILHFPPTVDTLCIKTRKNPQGKKNIGQRDVINEP